MSAARVADSTANPYREQHDAPASPADAATPALPSGRHDSGLRRQSLRSRRERGCWVYIPAEDLLTAGIGLDEAPPFYRTWGRGRGSVLVRLYRQR